MRWFVLIGFLLLSAGASAGENIVEVLLRSQQMRLDTLPAAPAGTDAAQALHAVFDELVRFTGIEQPVELRVIEGETVAETLLGHVVVVNAALGLRPRTEQFFVLAHELGHVAGSHQDEMGMVFRKWVPGEVVQEHTDAVAPMLGREASGLAHRQEYAADAFALRTLCAMGYTREEVVEVFVRMGSHQATATHPAGAKRAIALRVTPLDNEDAPARAALARVEPMR